MNIDEFKTYRFAAGSLTEVKTGKKYRFSIDENDRYYQYMKKYIKNEGVESEDEVRMDEIVIEDKSKTFLEQKTFVLDAVLLLTDKNNDVHSYEFSVNPIKIVEYKFSSNKYEKGFLKLNMYGMKFLYKTRFKINKVND